MRRAALQLAMVGALMSAQALAQNPNQRLTLAAGWQLQSAGKVADGGAALSLAGYDARGWYPATVPETVFAALVQDHVYPEPGIDMNLRKVPGYPGDMSFTRVRGEDPLRPTQTWTEHWLFHAPNHDEQVTMPADSPFKGGWWYRREFRLPANFEGRRVWLQLEGLNYRADLWMNGHRIATKDKLVGAFRAFEFDITDDIQPGENALAIEVFPPHLDDLAINWVDVSPTPPDDNTGLWQGVILAASGPVSVRYPQVSSHLDLPSLATAQLTVSAELHNATAKPVKGVLSGRIGDVRFSQAVTLRPQESRRVAFTPGQYPQLDLRSPRLWWPWQMGPQNLYTADLQFSIDGAVSDRAQTRFGIREVSSELTPEGYRLFKVNGRRLLVRGGGWWPDMLLRSSAENEKAQMLYARGMNLNTIRMDGKFGDETLLNLADEYGMMLMPGWACCDHWEKWQSWKAEDYMVAAESMRTVARRFRNHPSVLAWLNGDDNPPPEKVARLYVDVLRQENWQNPILASATGKPAAVTGSTGVKMLGPYDYVPPSYWLRDTKLGGAFGFNTETSMGGAVPPLASLKEFLSADHLWPLGEEWDFHAGGGKAFVKDLQATTDAITATYGAPTSAADYAMKSQVINYDGQRAMFEGYSRNKYHATGVLHEMLNQAWPSVIWQMYDTTLRPGGSYFGAKLGCEPLHIQYSYDDRSIVVVNSLYRPFKGLTASATVYDFDLAKKFSKTVTVDADADSSHRVFTIPELSGLTTTYFVRLILRDAKGTIVSRNFYWLSTKPDVYLWDKSTWFYTPTTSTADMTMLALLPKVRLRASQKTVHSKDEARTVVTLENPTAHLAFFVHLRVMDGKGKEILPILWDDNYFELLPGESRKITATYAAPDDGEGDVELDGWNEEPERVPAATSPQQPKRHSKS